MTDPKTSIAHPAPAGEFAGQTAIVTGAAGGLGRAIARLLAGRGCHVALADLDEDGLGRTAGLIAAAGGSCETHKLDVTDDAGVAAFREAFARDHGGPHILVNNAGGWRHAELADITKADWDWILDLNARSVLNLTRAFMPPMIAQRYGRVVNICSVNAYEGRPQIAAYAAAKAAVLSLTRSFAVELAPHQVLVNAVSPGPIATEMAKSQGWLTSRLPLIPLGRVAEPEDIAEIVAFLASSRNRIIVGEGIMANGGLLMA